MASKSHHRSSSKCNHRHQVKIESKSPQPSDKKVYYSPTTRFQIKSTQKSRSKAKSPCKCKFKQKGPANGCLNNIYSNREFPSHYLDYAPEFSCSNCQHLPLALNENYSPSS